MPHRGRQQRVEAKDVWKGGANDFTHWVQANMDLHGEALRFDVEATEGSVVIV